jgi:small subunit ribosomal protein S16
MAVKIRLKRLGNRNRPFYRITAVDERRKRDGAVIEELGIYNPIDLVETRQASIKLDRCAYWLSVGAQPSETVASLLRKAGLKPVPGTKVEDQNIAQPAAAAQG